MSDPTVPRCPSRIPNLGVSTLQNMIMATDSCKPDRAGGPVLGVLVRFILLIVGARTWIGLMNGHVVE